MTTARISEANQHPDGSHTGSSHKPLCAHKHTTIGDGSKKQNGINRITMVVTETGDYFFLYINVFFSVLVRFR